MKRTIFLFALLILLTPAAHAQKQAGYPRTLFVTFANAPVYDSASYLSNVSGSMRVGDSITALGSAGKFFHISFNDRDGYILGANVAAKRPAANRAAPKKSGTNPAGRSTGATSSEPDHVEVTARARIGARGSDTLAKANRENASADSASAGSTKSAGASSEQCRAVTKSGTRCSRTTSDPSGYCWQHRKASAP